MIMELIFLFQFEDFRSLRNEENRTMSNNFRAVQPLGDRIVLYNLSPYDIFYDDAVEQQALETDIEYLNEENLKNLLEAEGS